MEQTHVDFHMERSAQYRVVYVDGAFGGTAPSGLIHMVVYSESQAMPTKITHKIVGGKLAEEISALRQSREGLTRELESDLVFSIETAQAIKTWLEEKINEAAKLREVKAAFAASATQVKQ